VTLLAPLASALLLLAAPPAAPEASATAPPAGADANVLAKGTRSPRSLAERFAETVNVRDFGAKADGGDDAPAFQAAIDHAVKSQTRTLHIPAGTYTLGASLNLQGVWGLQITGAGVGWYNTTRLIGRHGGRPVFDAVGANMLVFEDLVVMGSPGEEAPSAAFLFSRNASNAGAGMHELRHVWANGHFTKAAVVTLSSEANKYDACVFTNAQPGGHAFWTEQGNARAGMVSDFGTPPDVQSGGNTMFEFSGTHFTALGGGKAAAVKGSLVNASFVGCYTNSNGWATFDLSALSDSAIIALRDESSSLFGFHFGEPGGTSRNVTILGSKTSRGVYAIDGYTLSHWTIASSNLNWSPKPDPPGPWVLNVDRLQYSWVAVSNGLKVRSFSRSNAFPAAGAGMIGGARLSLPEDARGDSWSFEAKVQGYPGVVHGTRLDDTPGTHLYAPRVEASKFKTRVQKLTAAAAPGGLTPDQALGSTFSVLLDGPLAVRAPRYGPSAANDADDGARMTFILTQDGRGGRPVTWDQAAFDPSGFTPTAAPGATSVVTFVADPTRARWVVESHNP
jgi:hypothetical protein